MSGGVNEPDLSTSGQKPDEAALPPELEAFLPPELEAAVPPDLQPKQALKLKAALAVAYIQQHQMVSPADPLRDKITSEHITTMLETDQRELRHEFLGSLGDKLFLLALFALALGFLVFLIVWLSASDRELLKDLLQIFLPFLGGIGCGIGLDEGARRLFKRD